MINRPQASTERAGLHTSHLILASASPRRRELLSQLGAPFTVMATDAEEDDAPAPAAVSRGLPPCPVPAADHPTLRAWRKAAAVWHHSPAALVLAADTIVVLDGDVLNKPRDAADAHAMLARLSGRVHTVYTGLCVCSDGPADSQPSPVPQPAHIWLDLVASRVTVAALSSEDIAAYVASGEPLDKAGAYGIQGLGGRLVQRVEGSYTAVVGLPLPATWRLLTAAGMTGLDDPTAAYHRWLSSQGKEPLQCPPTLP